MGPSRGLSILFQLSYKIIRDSAHLQRSREHVDKLTCRMQLTVDLTLFGFLVVVFDINLSDRVNLDKILLNALFD